VEYQIVPVTQGQKAYYFKTHSGSPVLLDSPQDAIFDAANGNMIFTMGHEGVLVRQAEGEYKLVQVGPYGKIKTAQLDVLVTILSGEFALAVCFGGLVVVVLGMYERSLLKNQCDALSFSFSLSSLYHLLSAVLTAMLSCSLLVAGILILPLVDGFHG
jgi:hypothetical protein